VSLLWLRAASSRARVVGLLVLLLVGAGLSAVESAVASPTLTAPLVQQVSTDTLPAFTTNSATMQHATEVEADTFSWGSTVVSSFEVGRNASGFGAQAIGFATSIDNGQTWTQGILPHVTESSPSPNVTFPVAVNQTVGYDAKNGQWIIPSVGYVPTDPGVFHEQSLLVNSSVDGVTWSDAITAVATDVDKPWVTCDNTSTSPHYGTCYVVYTQLDSGYQLAMVSSTDGGANWSAPAVIPGTTSGATVGYNANLVVQPSGKLVVVATDLFNGANNSALVSLTTSDAGATWSGPHPLATIRYRVPSGGIRAKNKPVVDIDAAGTVYAAWSDCRFHTGCNHTGVTPQTGADDIVYATSTNGTTWSAPKRVVADATTTTEDKFIPGFAVQPGTSGSKAHLAAVFYTYRKGSCATTCLVQAKYVTSYDGGTTWSAPYRINSVDFPVAWLAVSSGGGMVGDLSSVSFANGRAVTVVSLATAAPDAGPVLHQSEWALTLPTGWGARHRAALSSAASRHIVYRHSTTLRSRITDAATGTGLSGVHVTLQGRRGTHGAFSTVKTVRSSTSGALSATVAPRVNYQYRWSYPGSSGYNGPGHLAYSGARSHVQTVLVAQAVAVKATRTSAARGFVVRLYGVVAPSATGHYVSLQSYFGGAWHQVGHGVKLHSQRMPDGKTRTGYVLSYTGHTAGKKLLRVRRAATASNYTGYSHRVSLKVT
jgi:hypothetical protein